MSGHYCVYSSEDLIYLRNVLDEAVRCLPVDRRTRTAQSKIARRIMDCAATGERSRVELKIAGLADVEPVTAAGCGA